MIWLQRLSLVLVLASLSISVGCDDGSTTVPTAEEAAATPVLPTPPADNSSAAKIPAD
jgi:hypothetical protein